MFRVLGVLSLTIGALAWLAPRAHADSHTEAVALFDQGMKDMKAGDYAKACKELAASLEKVQDSGTKGSLAICYGHLGKTASAWLLWRALADTSTAKDLRDDAAKRAAALEAKVPKFIVKLKATIPGLVVEINGDKVDPTLGVAVPIDPGQLLVEAIAPGYTKWSAELQATEGQTTTIEVPALVKDKNAGKGPVGTGTAGVSFVGTLALGATSDGSFTKDGQQDGYTLELATKSTLKFEITHAGTKMGVDTVLFIYGPANGTTYPSTTVASDDDGGWGKLSKIASATLGPGKYAVVVASKGNARGTYRLIATCLASCPEGIEQVHQKDPKKKKGKKAEADDGGNRYEDNLAQGRRKRRHLVAIGIGAVGVGALGAGTYFGLQARSKYGEAKDSCGGDINNCPTIQIPTAQRRVDDARKAGNLSTAFVVGGLAAATLGVVVWVTAPSAEHRVLVTPAIGPDGNASLWLSGRF
jgi:hypothetical protein